ncbi:HPr kinase/phosphorylase [Sphingobium boeckii]|nr:HPr kinase/phosphatase C-terminal domain-containing protein [Sphingobium boeckii]
MLHASTVAIHGHAVLIAGPSGSGKSDLALRLIDRGATLVSDDYTLVKNDGAGLIACAAPNIAGRIEVRGIGIIETAFVDAQPASLFVQLSEDVIRMPGEDDIRMIAGIGVACITLNGLEASAPIKVEIALNAVLGR